MLLRGKQVQLSRKIWLKVKGFQNWLELLEDPTHVHCKICNSSMISKYSQLVDHALSNKHIKKSGEDCPSSTDFNIKEVEKEHQKEIAYIKLKIIGTLLRMNVAFKNTFLVVDLIRSLLIKYTDNKYLRNEIHSEIHVCAKTARNISINVIGLHEKLRLAKIFQTTKFFISVDEATDVTKNKSYVITVS